MRTDSAEEEHTAPAGALGALEALAESRVGQVAGDRWRLESVIGVGGTASVYAARHRNGRQAALKVLHPELARDARSRKRFLREAYAANRVGHPGAVSVIDDGALPDGTPFLLLELISGQPLGDFVKAGSLLPVSEVVAIGVGILDVLAAAHDAGVVHRDIKPSNVIVTADGRIKVLDFGIAKFHDATEHDPLLTRSEASLGTPAFMSPEQSAGRSSDVDARSDLWSVGATLFSLLTGRFVHTGSSANELLIASATRQAPSIASLRSDLPPSVVSAIDRALSLDRSRRWPNARAMKATLMGMVDDDPASVVTIPEESGAPSRQVLPARRAAIAAGLLVVAAVGLWFLQRATPGPEATPVRAEAGAALSPMTTPVPAATLSSANDAAEPPATLHSAEPSPAPDTRASPASRAVRSRAPARPMPAAQAPAPSGQAAAKPTDTLFDRRQ